MSDPKQYNITDETDLKIKNGSFTEEERDWLESVGVFTIRSHHTTRGEIGEAYIDFDVLAKIAFEYDLLRNVASRVEIDILEVFRLSKENTLTTSELAAQTDRPKSSVSRALSQLVEKNKLTKVQAGVYRYSQ